MLYLLSCSCSFSFFLVYFYFILTRFVCHAVYGCVVLVAVVVVTLGVDFFSYQNNSVQHFQLHHVADVVAIVLVVVVCDLFGTA